MNKLDHRRKYYMILDCETATVPFVTEFDAEARKQIAISKPLIYDFGYQIADKNGKVYVKRSYLVTEIFSTPSVFKTAYYAKKRPIYIQKLKNNEIELKSWTEIMQIFTEDLSEVTAVGAYNSMFDFKKAIPFTESYIKALYSEHYFEWEERQKKSCADIASNSKKEKAWAFDSKNFSFRGKKYPLFDLWGLACIHLLNNKKYKEKCVFNNWCTGKKYFPTNAEKAFAFITDDDNFSEAHTAIEDAEIETFIFARITKKTGHKFENGIVYFPFRLLGTVKQFLE